jgi:GT2 family glycosyltransferase
MLDAARLQMSEATRTLNAGARLHAQGKFLFAGSHKVYLRGVTYGPFRPRAEGGEYPAPAEARRDFACMAAHGLNAIRTYTAPPRWLLDEALARGLRVLVGLPWEQHIAQLDNRRHCRSIEQRVRAGARGCAGHPAVLGYSVGNEIPASIVRWHGARRVERFVARLAEAVRAEDPGALVTYVNYPSTEYLELPFADLMCFNVYLESLPRLEAYLARLHTLAGDRPLVLAEIGLDSLRHGEQAQAHALEAQVRAAFEAGCAGAFVFAWTDEWHRGGEDIDDWAFGLTAADRRPKPALQAVGRAYAQAPFSPDLDWPRMSVVVCAHNAGATLRECCEALGRLEYPDFEAIVVDDGSDDATSEIAAEYPVRLIRTENRGLSSARNTGMQSATGEIIAYLDSDAYPDPHWLSYLALAFLQTEHAAVGGPNLPPPEASPLSACIASAPGGPVHVLHSDSLAEHVPGCNLAVRKASLQAIGGFDPQFRVAGDDVDMCWRLQQQGWTIGFSPAAVVWHHPRASVHAFWKQQAGYGRAEALLERKWPEKYNTAGHITWAGRLYGGGRAWQPWRRGRIFYGTWGSAPFQSIYQPAAPGFWSLPLMPEWYLGLLALAGLTLLGLAWRPLLIAGPLLALAASLVAAQALLSSRGAEVPAPAWKWRSLVALLHLLQPLARLWGRLRCGLTLWRRNGPPYIAVPRPWSAALWCERWQPAEARVRALEAALREEGVVVLRGGDFDRWDLEARAGTLGGMRLRLAVEEHGRGRQLVRCLWWPSASRGGLALTLALAALAVGAARAGVTPAAALLALPVVLLVLRTFHDWAAAAAAVLHALRALGRQNEAEVQAVRQANLEPERGAM